MVRPRSLRRKSDPDSPLRAPIPLGSRSNGEYFHTQTAHERRIEAYILRRADELSRRHGVGRREFLASSAGIATSLAAINLAACGGDDGGGGGSTAGTGGSSGQLLDSGSTTGNGFDVDSGGTTGGVDDTAGSTGDMGDCTPLPGPEFIFDVQTHHVDPGGSWRRTNPSYVTFFESLPQSACGPDAVECFSADHYIELMFLESETSMAVLSGVPATICNRTTTTDCGNPLDNDGIVATRELIAMLASSPRSVNHAMITPNVDLPLQLDMMQQLVEELGVGGWKCYPPWGPNGDGFSLDDPAIGIPFIEQGRDLGVKTFCIHKGLQLLGFDGVHTDPTDVAAVAALYPDCNFVVYHSAWLHGGIGAGEGPYDPMGRLDPLNPTVYPVDAGVNSLITAMLTYGLGPGSNVYAELGSVWTNLMVYPDQAAHVLGKLLRYVGEDNILWGTDCIWTGSPQPLIESFRAFQISEQFQETYGYPALTPEIKAKIFGRNAAPLFGVDPEQVLCEIEGDAMSRGRRWLDAAYGRGRGWGRAPLGPRTRAEARAFVKANPGPG